MGLILLEALLALVVLVFIVWWTMFHGRPRGEPPPPSAAPNAQERSAEGVDEDGPRTP